jgi:hypothetical protein
MPDLTVRLNRDVSPDELDRLRGALAGFDFVAGVETAAPHQAAGAPSHPAVAGLQMASRVRPPDPPQAHVNTFQPPLPAAAPQGNVEPGVPQTPPPAQRPEGPP